MTSLTLLKLFKTLAGQAWPDSATFCNSTTRQRIELESCSNPLEWGESCSLQQKRIFFQFGMSDFCLCLHDGIMFMDIRFELRWSRHPLGANQTSRFYGSKFYWILS